LVTFGREREGEKGRLDEKQKENVATILCLVRGEKSSEDVMNTILGFRKKNVAHLDTVRLNLHGSIGSKDMNKPGRGSGETMAAP
jgi:hypothetical protein